VNAFKLKFDFLFFLFFYVFDFFNMLILKIIFKNKKNIILIYLQTKKYFKKQKTKNNCS
jgi:hypothetical protein